MTIDTQEALRLLDAMNEAWREHDTQHCASDFCTARDKLRALLSAKEGEPSGEGRNDLWTWFGLSYAAWLVMPRVMMHAMPDEWQDTMADLLTQWDATWRNMPDVTTSVTLRSHGKMIKTPDYLINYRYPDTDALESMKALRDAEKEKGNG